MLTLLIFFSTFDDPGPNKPDEPLAKQYSLERALDFLDAASLTWQKGRACMTCHTNYAYLTTLPSFAAQRPAFQEVRKFAEELVSDRWEKKGPRWPAEVVMTALALATSDAETTGKLHPLTRKALDRMWTVQRKDGGWDWLKCNWPPMESDDHFGATAALLAVGRAPEGYASDPAVQEGISKIKKYFEANPPQHLHQKAMVYWGSKYVAGVMTEAQQKETLDELLALQRPDGGWSLAGLGRWKRTDGKEQDADTSDGYGTGFTLYMARLGGVAADDPRVRRGLEWLKSNQRESGRWFTRSLNKDSKHFITHAGSAFAVLALQTFGR